VRVNVQRELGESQGHGEPGLDALPPTLGPEAGLRVPSRLHYTELLNRTLPHPETDESLSR
jgi:hypothetical protein